MIGVTVTVWRSDRGWEARVSPSFRRHEALFRTFAEIGPSAAGIETFSREFSSPGAPVERLAVDRGGRLILFISRNPPEITQSADWCDQVLDLRRCVHLWDLLRAGDEHGLARHIRWRSDAGGLSVHYDSHPDLDPGASPPPPDKRVTSVIASAATDRELLQCLKPGDTRAPALLYIEMVVNGHLDDLVQSRLLCAPQQEVMVLHPVPKNLLGGLWVQLAQAVADKKDYARCKECRAWFEVSLPAARKTRLYCSDSCKVKAYTDRKDRAVRLKAQGWTVKQIAEELGTDKDTVKGWLGKKK
jgi:hypothetical protein